MPKKITGKSQNLPKIESSAAEDSRLVCLFGGPADDQTDLRKGMIPTENPPECNPRMSLSVQNHGGSRFGYELPFFVPSAVVLAALFRQS